MSCLSGIFELVLLAVVLLDTLGFIVQLRRNGYSDVKDFTRVCFTWVFFFVIKSLFCSCCYGFGFFGIIVAIFITRMQETYGKDLPNYIEEHRKKRSSDIYESLRSQ